MMRPLFSFYLTFSLALVLLGGLLQPSLGAPSHHHARPNAGTPKLKDSMVPPRNWIDLGPAPPLQDIWLRIALPQARFSELEQQLYQMSDPKNARYGQHLLKEQVTEFVRPDPRSVQAVDAWLASYGIKGDDRVRHSAAGDWVTILVPVAVAESMLDTVSRVLALVFHLLLTLVCGVYLRSSTFGRMSATVKTGTSLSARPNTASRNTYTRILNLCSPQRTSVAPSR